MPTKKRPLPNRAFAAENADFRACCGAALTEPTVRQASRFRLRKGLAYAQFKRGVRSHASN
jgi:hypothetical protein